MSSNKTFIFGLLILLATATASAQIHFSAPSENAEYCDYVTATYSADQDITNITLWLNDVPIHYHDMVTGSSDSYYINGSDLSFGENILVISGTATPAVDNDTVMFYYTGVCPEAVTVTTTTTDYTMFVAFAFLIVLILVIFGVRMI